MAGEEAVDKADLVADKKSETKTEKAGAQHKSAVEPREAVASKRKWQSQGGGNQHHSYDGAHAEDQQIKNSPTRLANRA